MMRVLWVFEHLQVQPQLCQVAYQLAAQRGVSLEVISAWDNQPPLDPERIPISRFGQRRKLDLRARRVIRGKLRAGRFEIAHAYSSRDLANLLGARHGVPTRPKMVGYRGIVGQLRRRDPANWITFWHPAVDQITCVCHAAKRALQRSGLPAARLSTVWEGCDAGLIETPPREILRQYDIPPGAFVVGTVANMRPVKGVDILLRAAMELPERRDIYWLLVGDVRDPQIRPLAADPRIASRVRLIGPQSLGGRFSGLMDVYVAPSRSEGLSMGIMEAMVQRTCPVVTDVGGSPELIRHEVDGLVVPPESPRALAEAIRRLYTDGELRRKLARSAHQRAVAEFSIANWTDRLYETYLQLLDQSPRGAVGGRAA